MASLRVGYVPEHFSMPILKLAESEWGRANITLVAQPSGTGQMLTSLSGDDPPARQIDVAIALTEALIAGLAKGRTDYTLIGTYVKSSLNWAVITGTNAKAAQYNSIADLRGTRIGISRIGSGSQIMASVMALQHGWTDANGDVQKLEFKVNDTFANLRNGVNQHEGLETSAFMWEWFTTLPFATSGEVRFIGNVPTPWPSWTLACSKSIDAQQRSTLDVFQSKLQDSIAAFTAPSAEAESLHAIEEHFNYRAADVKQWWSGVRWVQDQRPELEGASAMHGQSTSTTTVSEAVLRQTLDLLEKAGVFKAPSSGWSLNTFVAEPARLTK